MVANGCKVTITGTRAESFERILFNCDVRCTFKPCALIELTKCTNAAGRMQINQINLSRKVNFSASTPMPLKTLLVAILALLSLDVGVAAAQATPFRTAQAGSIITVASGCGLGVNRGPYNGCDPIDSGYFVGHHRGYYRGYYRGYAHGYYDGYYDGSGRSRLVDQGACSGFRMYRVCDIYGMCWAACN
jgi:hypothetical protein